MELFNQGGVCLACDAFFRVPNDPPKDLEFFVISLPRSNFLHLQLIVLSKDLLNIGQPCLPCHYNEIIAMNDEPRICFSMPVSTRSRLPLYESGC